MEGSAELRKTGFQLTWNQLKWIAIISMIIDHTSKVLFPQIFYIEQLGMDIKTSYMIHRLLPAVGRIAFPIFIRHCAGVQGYAQPKALSAPPCHCLP